MRHRDINLTMGIYTHTSGQESKAVANLPDLSLPSIESQRNVKTGTDNMKLTGNNLACKSAHSSTNMHSPLRASLDNDIKNGVFQRARQDSNLQPSDSKSATLSN